MRIDIQVETQSQHCVFFFFFFESVHTSLCRMTTDLNLHRKAAVTSQDTQEGRTRDVEVRNRERTWILCFALDQSFSAQMGKPSPIRRSMSSTFFSSSIINTRASYIIRHTHESLFVFLSFLVNLV